MDAREGPITVIQRDRKCSHVGVVFAWKIFQRQWCNMAQNPAGFPNLHFPYAWVG